MNIDDQIKKAEAELERLKAKKEDQVKFKLTSAMKLADIMHSTFCHHNDIDQCGYEYEEWGAPSYSKKKYLELAEQVLQVVDFETASSIFQLFIGKYI